MSDSNSVTFLATTEISDGGHEHVRLIIKESRAMPITEAVTECQNGKRYHDADVNERVGTHLQELSGQGYNTMYDHYSGDMYIRIMWQVYKREGGKTEYCRPTYEFLGQEFPQIEVAMKYLRKVGSRIETVRAREDSKRTGWKCSKSVTDNDTFRSVEEVVAALKFLKAVEVSSVKFGSYDRYEVAA